MRLLKTIFILLCSLLLISCSQQDPVYHDTQGHAVQLTKLRGKWVIVNYWAAWCHPCVDEMPELNNFYKYAQDKNILIYGVDFDELPIDDLTRDAQSVGIAFPVLVDDPEAWGLDEVSVIPTTFIINPKGVVVKKLVGSITEQTLIDVLHTLQNE